MISIPGSLSFAKTVLMLFFPAKSGGNARYTSQDLFVCSFVRSSVRPSIRPSVHLSVRPFVHLFITAINVVPYNLDSNLY